MMQVIEFQKCSKTVRYLMSLTLSFASNTIYIYIYIYTYIYKLNEDENYTLVLN